MRIKEIYEQARAHWVAQGQKQGLAQGRTKARAADLLTVLRVRGIRVSKTARERILTETDAERLKRWLERAAVARTLAQVFGDRS